MFNSKRFLSSLVSLLIILTSILYIPSSKVYAASSIPRLEGKDRYETAVQISKHGWASSQNVILATGEDYPDALCAAPLAKQLMAPILLTEGTTLNTMAEQEITRLGARNIFIVGGEGVVSKVIKQKLESYGLNVTRLFGTDRYQTSVSVANYISNNFRNADEVIVTTGNDFPDALSAAPAAAVQGMPILLSEKTYLPDSVNTYIKDRKIQKAYIIGGAGVVNDSVLSTLPNPERIWGKDRYDTNAAVIDRFKNVLNFSDVYIATGENFPDALAGSALAPKSSAPVVLTAETLEQPTRDLINAKYSLINNMYALGGDGVVKSTTLQSILSSNVNIEGNSLNNLNNFGIASVQGGYIYYSNFSDNQNLYKMKVDGSFNIKLTESGGLSHINVLGDWIYYSGNDGKLYKMKTDGSQNTVVVSDEVYFTYVTADSIYFYSDGSLYKMKHDGSSKTSIVASTDPWHYYISDGYVYYVDNGGISKVKMDGTGGTVIINGDVSEFSVSQNSIYYIGDENKLYKKGIDGRTSQQLTSDTVKDINVKGNWVYYINVSDGDKLYKVAVDGSSRTKIGSTSIYDYVNIAGDNIFCVNDNFDFTTYRMDTNGMNKTAIGSDKAASIKLAGNLVYYVNTLDSNNIYKMGTDGSLITSLNVSSSSEIEVDGDFIYYSNQNDNNKLYKIKNDKSQNVKVLDDSVGYFKIFGGFIYYSSMSDGNKLYKMEIDGTGKMKLSDRSVNNILADNDWVYYFNEGIFMENSDGEAVPADYGIYKVKADGSGESLFQPVYIDDMSISGDYLIYHSFSDSGEGEIYKIKLNGTERSLVAGSAVGMAVDGDYIYKLDDNETVISKYDKNGTNLQDYSISAPVYYLVVNSGQIYYETIEQERKLYNISTYGGHEKNF